MALLAAACRKSVLWLNCGWLLPVDGGGGGGDGAGVIGSIGFGFNDDTSCMKFFNRANYKDIELCLAATR